MNSTTFPIDFAVITECTEIYSTSSYGLELPFKTSPEKYLSYAEEDLATESERGNANAYHNAKRAISCQIDCILWAFSLSDSQRLPIPRKLELFSQIGLLSPRIVKKVNLRRNMLEHEYEKIDRDSAEDAVDVALLFVAALARFVTVRYSDFEFWNERAKIGGAIDWDFGDDKKYSTDAEEKQPLGLILRVFRSTRTDDCNPAEIDIHNEGGISTRLTLDEFNKQRGYEHIGCFNVPASDRQSYLILLSAVIDGIR